MHEMSLSQSMLRIVEAQLGGKRELARATVTMGPFSGDPELARPYFVATRTIFEELGSLGIAGAEMRYLSMGMSNSFRVAIEEGANLIRVGTLIFGPRE